MLQAYQVLSNPDAREAYNQELQTALQDLSDGYTGQFCDSPGHLPTIRDRNISLRCTLCVQSVFAREESLLRAVLSLSSTHSLCHMCLFSADQCAASAL